MVVDPVVLRDLLRERKKDLALMTIIGPESPSRSLFRLWAANLLLDVPPEAEGSRDFDELLISLQDFPIPFSKSQMIDMMRRTGLVTISESGTVHLNPAVDPAPTLREDHFTLSKAMEAEIQMPMPEVRDAIKRWYGTSEDSVAFTVKVCTSAIRKCGTWGIEIGTKFSRDYVARQVAGMSVFWNCTSDGHEAADRLPASQATVDLGFLIAEPGDYHLNALLPTPGVAHPITSQLVSALGELQVSEAGNDLGGIVIRDDNDFPGATKPTVESTSSCISALTLLARTGLVESGVGVDSMLDACRGFVLRMQLRSGGWATYRYPGHDELLPPRAHPSMRALEALSHLAAAQAPPRSGSAEIVEAAHRFVAMCASTARISDGAGFWAPGFSDVEAESSNCLQETAWTIQALAFASDVLGDSFSREDRSLVRAGARYVEAHWKPSRTLMAVTEFRVPTENGPSGQPIIWRPPGNAVVGTSLIDCSLRKLVVMSEELEQKVGTSVGQTLRSQHPSHGHWDMALTRNPKAFPSTARIEQRLIASFLAYELSQLQGLREK